MIDTIVFDIGNVLAKYGWREYLMSFGFSDEVVGAIAKEVFLSPLWKEFDRGVMGDENVKAACMAKLPQYENELMKVFDKMGNLVHEYSYSEGLIRRLKDKGYKIYVLSNYGRTLYGYARMDFRFLRHIDGGVISYEVQYIKPEPQIYQHLIKKYNINPYKAVFLDDTPENLMPARELGMRTIAVTNYNSILNGFQKLQIEL